MTREICKICYNVNRIGFSVSDDMWSKVAPIGFNKVICINCFTRLADEKLVRWDNIRLYPVSLANFLNIN